MVAFFVPLSWRDTMPDDSDSLLNKMGFSNGTGKAVEDYSYRIVSVQVTTGTWISLKP